jgi:hypothetical protein
MTGMDRFSDKDRRRQRREYKRKDVRKKFRRQGEEVKFDRSNWLGDEFED